MKVKVNNANVPQWAEVVVKSTMPPGLCELQEIAYNIWWVWKYEAVNLFRDVDPETWHESGRNPILMLETVSYQRLKELTQDKAFMSRLKKIYTEFRKYRDT